MSGGSYWDTGPGDPGRPVIKFTKIKPPAMQVSPIPCTLCKKSFYQYVHLQQHSRCHSGRRPFKCHTCNRSFLQLSHLVKHRFVKHEVKKKCQSCGSMYSRWSTYLRHTIQAHGARTLVLPKPRKTVDIPEVEKAPKPSLKLCIKMSDISMTENDMASESRKSKKRKKHKKHKSKKEVKKSKRSKSNSSNTSDIKMHDADSKPRIILKLKMPKDSNEVHNDSSQVVNKDIQSKEPKTQVGAASTGTKQEAFTELVQSPSPKDSGIDDCSPLHETDHNENCSSNSASMKSGDRNKQRKDIATPATSSTSSPAAPSSLSTTPTSSLVTSFSPRCPTRQEVGLRSLMSAKDTPNSSAPSTPDDRKNIESCMVRRPRSSHLIKQEFCNSPHDNSHLSDVLGTPSPHTSVDADYAVPPSPSVPPLKLTISKKPAGKLRGPKYTSSLNVSSEFLTPVSPCESIASKSPRSVPVSPCSRKRHHSPFKANRAGHDQTEMARLIYSPDVNMTRSPRPAKSPRLCRMESSDTVYSASHQSSLSPPHSLKSERDFGPLNVDIDDPYAFDDDPFNNSPHLLPYSSTLSRRSDKYKLEPPVLELQIQPSISDLNDVKHKTRPKLTKQIDLKKPPSKKSPARSTSKDVKAPRVPRSGKRSKIEEKTLPVTKQEVIDESYTRNCDKSILPLTIDSLMAGGDSVLNSNTSEKENSLLNVHTDCRTVVGVVSDVTSKHGDSKSNIVGSLLERSSCSAAAEDASMPCLQKHSESVLPTETTDNQEKAASEEPHHTPDVSNNGGFVKAVSCSAQSSEETYSKENPGVEASELLEQSSVVTDRVSKSELASLSADVVSDVLSEVNKELSVKKSEAVVNQELAPTDIAAQASVCKAPTTSEVLPTDLTAQTDLVAAASAEVSSSILPDDSAEQPMNVSGTFNDSDLLLSDPHLDNLSFNDSFLELGNDVSAPATTGDTLFDDLHDGASPLHTLETASKASSMESKRKVESDPIVVTLPGEAGMEAISLVIGNEDSDHFGESDDDDFDLASSLSSAPLAATSLTSITNSTPVKRPTFNATAAVVDTDSEFADLQSTNISVEPVASKPPITGFFNAFANFVGVKQSTDIGHSTPGYCSEFAKFLSQKSVTSEDGVFSDSLTDGLDQAEIQALKHEYLCVEKLCEQVWRLLRTVFPYLELPVYMRSSSPCGVEGLIDQVIGIVNEEDHLQTQTEPSVLLCAKPGQCLTRLRTKVCRLLVTILPDVSLPPLFCRTGEEVDKLIAHVIDVNIT